MSINTKKAVIILIISAVWLNLAGAVTVMAQDPISESSECHVLKLTISPTEVGIGESTTIKVLLEKTGEEAVLYVVELRINDVVEVTRELYFFKGFDCPSCGWHSSAGTEQATFIVVKDEPGINAVDVNGFTGSFSVKSVREESVISKIPEAPATPNIESTDATLEREKSVTSQTPPTSTVPEPASSVTAKSSNLTLFVGIAGAVLSQGILILFLLRRRRASPKANK